jgi:hypothetical protein
MLSDPDRRYVREALVTSLLIPAGFRTLGVPRTQHLLRNWASRSPHIELSSEETSLFILHVLSAQTAVHRNIGIEGTCLSRSLALWAMLLRRRVPVELRVGFRRQDGKVKGHAWVEYQGAPINEETTIANSYITSSKDATFDALFSKKL